MAVLTVQLRVHGLEGLRIVDASMMPTVTTTNTNAPRISPRDDLGRAGSLTARVIADRYAE
jgi:hypothetical protein